MRWTVGARSGGRERFLNQNRPPLGMSCYIRPRRGGASVYFTVYLAERGSGLLMEEILRLRAAVREVHEARPFHIGAWVVLPDHIHAVWTLPPGDSDFSTRWSAIKARFSRGLPPGARRASHETRREKAIWQRRFWEHHVRDVAEYDRLVRYCRDNPVKHGLVERAVDWPYSSIHRDIRLGLVEAERGGDLSDGRHERKIAV